MKLIECNWNVKIIWQKNWFAGLLRHTFTYQKQNANGFSQIDSTFTVLFSCGLYKFNYASQLF